MTKWQCVVFTINNWTLEDKKLLEDAEYIRYCSYGEEIGEEEHTPHLQGYLQTTKRVSFSYLQKILPRAHLIRSMPKNAISAAVYTKKGEQTKAEWEEHKEFGPNYGKNAKVTEWGEMLPGQGKRTDLSEIKKKILEEKIPINKVVTDLCENHQQLRYAEGLAKYISPDYTYKMKEVYWYWGPTGTGKTRAAFDMAYSKGYTNDDIWLSSRTGSFIQGYWGQPFVIIDELRAKNWEYDFLLELTDGIERRVNQKGTDAIWKPKIIVITAPVTPEETYRGQMAHWDHINQLLRRINAAGEIREFREDKIEDLDFNDTPVGEKRKRDDIEEDFNNDNVKRKK